MLTTFNYPKITVVRPQGYLNVQNAWEFEQDVSKALTQDANTIIVIDLVAVASLDNTGLMSLLSALKQANSVGKTLQISSVSPAIKIIFELTRLDQVLEILEIEPELAVA